MSFPCTSCQSDATRVLEVRVIRSTGDIRRRHQCEICDTRFSTRQITAARYRELTSQSLSPEDQALLAAARAMRDRLASICNP